jgi:uncharacterized metal-binding protein
VAIHVRHASRPLQPSLVGTLMAALFAMFWLTVLASLVLGAVLLLLARSVVSLAT